MEYKEPSQELLMDEYFIKYSQEFLKLNNLHVGNEVEMNFRYEVLRPKINSSDFEKYTFRKNAKGILKLDSKRALFAESFEDMDFYENRKGKYVLIKKKSVIKIGQDSM